MSDVTIDFRTWWHLIAINTRAGEMKFWATDVVNPEDYIADGDFNPHNVRPWLIHNEYGTLAIVYAEHEQYALDLAVDNDKLDSCQVPDENLEDYRTGTDSDGNGEYDVAYLGNASEPFDLTYIGIVPLPNKQYGDVIPQDDEEAITFLKHVILYLAVNRS